MSVTTSRPRRRDLMHPRVWGGVRSRRRFHRSLVDCKPARTAFVRMMKRIKGDGPRRRPVPVCGNRGTLTAPRLFNLMFKTFHGPGGRGGGADLPASETAQGIYVTT